VFVLLDEFSRGLLSKEPSVALVTWVSEKALKSFVARLGPALRTKHPDTTLLKLACADLDSASFEKKLLARLRRKNIGKCCLLVYQIEPLARAAAGILNGYRERLASFRAVVLVIRDNRRRDFLIACPDLMDWVGTCVARAEDLGPPIVLREDSKRDGTRR